MTTQRKKPKPRRWKPREDARACVECEKEFHRGDLVYQDVAITIHAGCLRDYLNSLRILGLIGEEVTRGKVR